MLKIIIACGGGFSSSHLVRLLQDQIAQLADKDNYRVEFLQNVTHSGEALKDYDVIMCCPHLRYSVDKMIENHELQNVPVYIIPPKMYGAIKASEILADAKAIVEGFKENPINPFHFPGEENPLRITRVVSYEKSKMV